MATATTIVFWVALIALLWPLVGYPALLMLLRRRMRPRSGEAPPFAPTVCVVITSADEGDALQAKLLNTLASDWPRAQLEIIVVSDGSTDNTTDVAMAFAERGVRTIALPSRCGKHACQGYALASTTADVIVFTDISATLEPSSLAALVAPLAWGHVGCVSGVDYPAEQGQAESVYVRYEMALRRLESEVAGLVGASGCLFAVRRALCANWESHVASDLALPLRARQAGFITVDAEGAVCRYFVATPLYVEYKRKVRTVVHGLETLRYFTDLLDPRRSGFFALQLASHKLLRWLTPFFLPVLIASALRLAGFGWVSAGLIVMSGVVVLSVMLAVLAARGPGKGPLAAVFGGAAYVILSQLAIMVAWRQFARGDGQPVWTPTVRGQPTGTALYEQ